VTKEGGVLRDVHRPVLAESAVYECHSTQPKVVKEASCSILQPGVRQGRRQRPLVRAGDVEKSNDPQIEAIAGPTPLRMPPKEKLSPQPRTVRAVVKWAPGPAGRRLRRNPLRPRSSRPRRRPIVVASNPAEAAKKSPNRTQQAWTEEEIDASCLRALKPGGFPSPPPPPPADPRTSDSAAYPTWPPAADRTSTRGVRQTPRTSPYELVAETSARLALILAALGPPLLDFARGARYPTTEPPTHPPLCRPLRDWSRRLTAT